MSSDDLKKLNDLKEEAKKALDKLVINKFPKKILEFEKLLVKYEPKKINTIKTDINIPIPEKPKSGQTTDSQVRTGLDKRVFLFPDGVTQTNDQMLKFTEEVRPLVLEFLADMRELKFAVTLMVPKVEDGNNFGVAIQETVMHAIGINERWAQGRLSKFEAYFNSRGNIICWIAKWPHCDDFRKCLEEADQKFFLILCLMVSEMREGYIYLNDLIVKNLEKVKNPRPIRDTSVY